MSGVARIMRSLMPLQGRPTARLREDAQDIVLRAGEPCCFMVLGLLPRWSAALKSADETRASRTCGSLRRLGWHGHEN